MTRREETDPRYGQVGRADLAAADLPDDGDEPMQPEPDRTVWDNESAARDTLADDEAYSMTGSPPGYEDAPHDMTSADDTGADLADVRKPHAPNGSIRHEAAPGEHGNDHAALFEDSDSERFRSRWHDVQAAFVDDPRRAVQDADQLVAELMRTLTATFAERKQSLEGQWHRGGDVETEDLRLALRGYRSFFDQLLPH